MSTPERFDHVLVGTGQATATLLAGLPDDASIAVAEGGRVGGTCVNDGCTPTKTLIAAAKVAHQARRADVYGIDVPDVEVDFAAVMERVHAIRGDSRDGLTRLLEDDPRVTLVRGWGRFVGERTLAIGDRVVRGEQVFLNVGARARVPELPGLDTVPWLDNTRLLELQSLPEHLVVVGGSYVGLEMAHAFARLGSRVTVLEAGLQLIGHEDPDIARAVREVLEREGLDVRTDVAVRSVEPATGDAPEDAGVRVHTDAGTVDGSHLLVAVGRVPNSERLDLDAAGVATDARGYVKVDDQTRTTAPGVWALGDVNGRGGFTHTSVNDAQIALDALHGASRPRTLSERTTIYTMFVDPPLGRAGLSQHEAEARGLNVRVATRPMSKVARANEAGEAEGMIKIVADGDDDRLLGVAAFGLHGDEIANLVAVAIHAGVDVPTLRRTVLAHPTVAELLPWILDALAPPGAG